MARARTNSVEFEALAREIPQLHTGFGFEDRGFGDVEPLPRRQSKTLRQQADRDIMPEVAPERWLAMAVDTAAV